MSESKHIKGPWTCDHFRDRSLIHKYNDHEPHEDCKGDLLLAKVAGIGEIREATATLMAAAPDLLAVVQKAVDWAEQPSVRRGELNPIYPGWEQDFKAAIAKAKGEI
jgi:hypothetical protein